MLSIKMARGDIKHFKIAVREGDGSLTNIPFTDIYFTVKRLYRDEGYKFQKRLSNGTIMKDLDGYYEFSINPEDTNDLAFGEYAFDIELVDNGSIKQTTVGRLWLTEEVTYQTNEV